MSFVLEDELTAVESVSDSKFGRDTPIDAPLGISSD